MFVDKTRSLTLLLAALLGTTCSGVFAQSSEPPERPKRIVDPDQYYHAPNSMHGKTVVLPIGTTFEGRIDHTISSAGSVPGTRFNVIIDSPVMVNGTDVVIPAGSSVLGEVVEAVPASAVPHQSWQKKKLVHGKLRIQLAGLRTPDGATYPLVCAIKGEVVDKMHLYQQQYMTPIGTNVGYVGTAAGFEATNANRVEQDLMRQQRHGLGPQVMAKKEFLKDEIMGMGPERNELDFSSVRSLVLKKRDYYVYKGSPLTIKVTAPFKIGVGNPGMGVDIGSVSTDPRDPELPPPSMDRHANGGNPYGGGGMPQAGGPPPQQQNSGAVPPDSF